MVSIAGRIGCSVDCVLECLKLGVEQTWETGLEIFSACDAVSSG